MTVCEHWDNLQCPAERGGEPTTAMGVEAYRQASRCTLYECVLICDSQFRCGRWNEVLIPAPPPRSAVNSLMDTPHGWQEAGVAQAFFFSVTVALSPEASLSLTFHFFLYDLKGKNLQ